MNDVPVEECHWAKIDALELLYRPCLRPEDECYYYMLYPNLADLGEAPSWSSPVRNRIYNLKKTPEQAQNDSRIAGYKRQAIEQFACDLSVILQANASLLGGTNFTLIPMPPSKSKSDPNFDDRLIQVCAQTCVLNASIGAMSIDCLHTITSRPAGHYATSRPDLTTIKANTSLDPGVLQSYGTIILIDDLLTMGASFAACKQLIQDEYPAMRVIGLFWALAQRAATV